MTSPTITASRDPLRHRALADECHALGDALGALAHLIAAQTLEACAAGIQADAILRLYNVATGYFLKEEDARALYWYGLLLELDPTLARAYQNLAVIHARAGNGPASDACREHGYRLQRVFVEPVADPARRLLILCAGRCPGNVPFDTLLSAAKSTRIKYVIDYAEQEEDQRLPPFDLVFNAIGEPDVAEPLSQRLEQFSARCGRPMLNPPQAVVRTQRHQLADLLGGIDDVCVAPCVRGVWPPDSPTQLARCLSEEGVRFPLLARPAATHGGEGMTRCANMEELENALRVINGVYYLTQYVDYRDADGFFRKYRMVFVDRQPLPYHLAISPDWMVHYFSAQMLEHPWKIAEEHRFLHDPAAVLGERALAAIHAIGRSMDLDYAGVDFTLLADGRVLVFEANATMLIHRERIDGLVAHKNLYVERIVAAFEQMQARRTPAGKP